MVSRKFAMRIGELSKRTNVSPNTIRKWIEEGIIVPDKLPDGKIFFTDRHVAQINGLPNKDRIADFKIVTAMSSDDLARQVKYYTALGWRVQGGVAMTTGPDSTILFAHSIFILEQDQMEVSDQPTEEEKPKTKSTKRKTSKKPTLFDEESQ